MLLIHIERDYIIYLSDRGIENDHKRIKYETAHDAVLFKVYLTIQNGTLACLHKEIFKPFIKLEKELSIEQDTILWGYRF